MSVEERSESTVRHRPIPDKHQALVEQVLLNMALMDLLPPTANEQCLERAEQTNAEFDEWLKEND